MEEITDEKTIRKRNKFVIPGIRYLFALNGFLGFFTLYAVRVNINVAIVAMVNGTAMYNHNKDNETTSEECEVPLSSSNTTSHAPIEDGEFLWSSQLQGVILGAFYYGYCVSQIPGGRLSEIFSGKWVFGLGTVFTAVLTLLTPLAAQYHVGLLIALRALEGLSQGVTFPAIYCMLGKWLPDTEKGLIATLVHAGINIGTVTTMPLSGALCRSDWFGGWPSAFYVIGIFGCVWFLSWCLLVTDSPHTHPFISDQELKYITSNQTIDQHSDLPPIPWKKILLSGPFWALVFTQFCHDWSFYTIINDLPTYFSTILHFDIEKNGFLNAFPHLLQCIVAIIVGFVADAIYRKEIASMNFIRKFCNSAASFGCVFGLIGVCFSGCNSTMNVLFFMVAVGLEGICTCGYPLNHFDLSPEYAGTLMGIANTLSNLTGFIAPLVVGALTDKNQTIKQWRIVFIIASIILTVSTFIFIFFTTTENQNWAEKEPKDTPVNFEINSFKKKKGYRKLSE